MSVVTTIEDKWNANDRGILPIDFGFIEEIKKRSGQPVQLCYQCQKCAAGCPVSAYSDFHSNQIIRLLQYGLKETVLKSSAIWLCSGCETCGARCPNGINVGRVMDALRELALEEGVEGKGRLILLFHREFLKSVRSKGRVNETLMLARYKIKSGQLFSDLKLGLSLFRKGKLALFPPEVRNKDRVRQIFLNVEQRTLSERSPV